MGVGRMWVVGRSEVGLKGQFLIRNGLGELNAWMKVVHEG